MGVRPRAIFAKTRTAIGLSHPHDTIAAAINLGA
jgi:hypothetical protein